MCRPHKGLLNPRFKVFSLMVNDCKFPSWLGGRKYPNGVPKAGQLFKLPNMRICWNRKTRRTQNPLPFGVWVQIPLSAPLILLLLLGSLYLIKSNHAERTILLSQNFLTAWKDEHWLLIFIIESFIQGISSVGQSAQLIIVKSLVQSQYVLPLQAEYWFSVQSHKLNHLSSILGPASTPFQLQ